MTDQSDSVYEGHEWINHVMLLLSDGDTVYVNDRARSLEFTGHEPHPSDPAVYAHFEGCGTEYKAIIPTEETQWDSEPVLRTDAGTKVQVEELRIGDGTDDFILMDMTAEDYIKPAIDDGIEIEGYPEQRDRPDRDGQPIGICPRCDGDVVKEDNARAACTHCDEWCWLTQWNAYYNHDTQ